MLIILKYTLPEKILFLLIIFYLEKKYRITIFHYCLLFKEKIQVFPRVRSQLNVLANMPLPRGTLRMHVKNQF